MLILVIEDTDSIARMLHPLLEGRGHVLRTALAGVQGVDLAREEVPDVVLLDWTLRSSLSSADVCARLRKEEATRETPILVFGEVDEEAKSLALDAGALVYYTKPFSPLALLKEIEGLSRRSSGRIRVR